LQRTCDAELNSKSGSIALAKPRSSCTTRSTKNMSLGNLSTGSALMGLSGSKGSTLQDEAMLSSAPAAGHGCQQHQRNRKTTHAHGLQTARETCKPAGDYQPVSYMHLPRVSNMPYAILERSSTSSRFVTTPSAHKASLIACHGLWMLQPSASRHRV
jgi:hypothetical protein